MLEQTLIQRPPGGWQNGSSNTAPALQAKSTEFKSQYHKKKNPKKQLIKDLQDVIRKCMTTADKVSKL
jgi:hypothetical protein